MAEIPIILLAAGSSSRMGQPKQLLPWGNQTLIEFQVEKLLETKHPVCVVLGSSSEQILPLLKKYPVQVILNAEWESGMGTSVSVGIRQVLRDLMNAEAVVYTIIDQPLVTVGHLQKMIGLFKPGQEQILASRSEKGWLGVPAMYDVVYFSELSKLNGEQGAKTLIRKYDSKVESIDAGGMLEDMDTMESYHRLLTKHSPKNLSN